MSNKKRIKRLDELIKNNYFSIEEQLYLRISFFTQPLKSWKARISSLSYSTICKAFKSLNYVNIALFSW